MLPSQDYVSTILWGLGWLLLVVGYLVSVPWAFAEWRRYDQKPGEPAAGTAR